MPPLVNVTRTRKGQGIRDLYESVKILEKTDILVGIPAAHSSRRGGPINNASLLFIHTYGSPIRNIPARPVLQPAIKANWKAIQVQLRFAAKAAMLRNRDGMERAMQRAGVIASNGAKRWFTDPRNNWAPNAPSTIMRKGSNRPLIDTGQLRRSITYILRLRGSQSTYSAAGARESEDTP